MNPPEPTIITQIIPQQPLEHSTNDISYTKPCPNPNRSPINLISPCTNTKCQCNNHHMLNTTQIRNNLNPQNHCKKKGIPSSSSIYFSDHQELKYQQQQKEIMPLNIQLNSNTIYFCPDVDNGNYPLSVNYNNNKISSNIHQYQHQHCLHLDSNQIHLQLMLINKEQQQQDLLTHSHEVETPKCQQIQSQHAVNVIYKHQHNQHNQNIQIHHNSKSKLLLILQQIICLIMRKLIHIIFHQIDNLNKIISHQLLKPKQSSYHSQSQRKQIMLYFITKIQQIIIYLILTWNCIILNFIYNLNKTRSCFITSNHQIMNLNMKLNQFITYCKDRMNQFILWFLLQSIYLILNVEQNRNYLKHWFLSILCHSIYTTQIRHNTINPNQHKKEIIPSSSSLYFSDYQGIKYQQQQKEMMLLNIQLNSNTFYFYPNGDKQHDITQYPSIPTPTLSPP